MNPQELKIEHIAPYAQYALKGEFNGVLDIVTSIDYDFKTISSMNNGSVEIKNFKPELRPLSDLTKEMEHSLFTNKLEPSLDKVIPQEFFKKYWFTTIRSDGHFSTNNGDGTCTGFSYRSAPYDMIELLFSWHFDVFGLIEKGLAIDINTLKDK